MSDQKDRVAALNAKRAADGIAFCCTRGCFERIMRIDPSTIDQQDEDKCFFAQATGMRYDNAVVEYRKLGLTEQHEIDFAFIGEFDMLAEGDTKTEELTPVYRDALRNFQDRHRTAA